MLDGTLTPMLTPSGRSGTPAPADRSGYADPDAKVGYGYVMNQMGGGLTGDPRTIGLTAAVRASLVSRESRCDERTVPTSVRSLIATVDGVPVSGGMSAASVRAHDADVVDHRTAGAGRRFRHRVSASSGRR